MPLDIPHQDRCSFCAYLAGERPYTILERGEIASVLVTREQRGVGHVLVIPSEHRPTLLDLTPEEGDAVMSATIRAAAAIAASHDSRGIAVWQNNGIPARQSIPHLHVHVAGTNPNGGTEFGEVPELSIKATDEIAARLRSHLESTL